MRMALLLHWRSLGYLRPRYGLVDDEELFRVGTAALVCGDGEKLAVTRQELLLLEPVQSHVRRPSMAGFLDRRHEPHP